MGAVGRAALAVSSNPKVENAKVDTEALLASVRGDLVSNSAVSPEDVEAVDLATYPGMEGIKDELEKQVLFPLEHPEMASELGLAPKRGVIIHGDPGTGKTTVGRWLAHRLKGKFFLVREMMVHADIIKVFAAAKAAAPSVVFIDDADIVIGGWRPLDGHRGSDIFRFLRIELWLKTKLPDARKRREILSKYIMEDSGALELLGKEGSPPAVSGAAQTRDGFCAADLRRVVN